jgi:hypothetical protein
MGQTDGESHRGRRQGILYKDSDNSFNSTGQNTLLPITGTPITPIQFPSSYSHILHTNIMGSVAIDEFCAIRSRKPTLLKGHAVSRALALAEFKLIYWGPAREGYKVTTTNAVQNIPSFTEPI